jgi:hypothetical protein
MTTTTTTGYETYQAMEEKKECDETDVWWIDSWMGIAYGDGGHEVVENVSVRLS